MKINVQIFVSCSRELDIDVFMILKSGFITRAALDSEENTKVGVRPTANKESLKTCDFTFGFLCFTMKVLVPNCFPLSTMCFA